MNKISKELRSEISHKVYHALGQANDTDAIKATAKYKQRLKELSIIQESLNKKSKELKEELEDQGLYLDQDYHDKTEFSIRPQTNKYFSNADQIIDQVVIKLQYSNDPNFLTLLDKLINEVTEKEKITVSN